MAGHRDPEQRRRDVRVTGFISLGIGVFMIVTGAALAMLHAPDGGIIAVLGACYVAIGTVRYRQTRRSD